MLEVTILDLVGFEYNEMHLQTAIEKRDRSCGFKLNDTKPQRLILNIKFDKKRKVLIPAILYNSLDDWENPNPRVIEKRIEEFKRRTRS